MYLFWIILALIIFIGYYFYAKETKTIYQIFQNISADTEAEVKNSFFYYPQLKLIYNKTIILVSAMSSGSGGNSRRPPQTFAQFPLPKTDTNKIFVIQSKSIQASIDKTLGDYCQVNIGVPEVDNSFYIYGKSEAYIKRLFTQDIQNAILKLNSQHGIKVGIENADYFDGKIWKNGFRFDATIFKISTDEEEYQNLIRVAKLFYDIVESHLQIQPPNPSSLTCD